MEAPAILVNVKPVSVLALLTGLDYSCCYYCKIPYLYISLIVPPSIFHYTHQSQL